MFKRLSRVFFIVVLILMGVGCESEKNNEIENITGSAPNEKTVKAVFVYELSPSIPGWFSTLGEGQSAAALDTGIESLTEEYIQTGNSAEEGSQFMTTVENHINNGVNLVVVMNYGYQEALMSLATKYPDVVFEHVSGYKTNATNLGAYDIRFYEGRYLQGIVAGSLTQSNRIGFLLSVPIPESFQAINAFTIGVRKVNPDAVVEAKWVYSFFDPDKESELTTDLINNGADIIAGHIESEASVEVAEKNGVKVFGYFFDMSGFAPTTYLGEQTYNWGKYYENLIESIKNSTYRPDSYWGGFADEMISLNLNENLISSSILQLVNQEKDKLASDAYHPFSGPLFKIAGEDKSKLLSEGEVLPDYYLRKMDYFVEGVIEASN